MRVLSRQMCILEMVIFKYFYSEIYWRDKNNIFSCNMESVGRCVVLALKNAILNFTVVIVC